MNNPLRLTIITLLLAVSNLSAATLYVSLESTHPTPPYTNWVTAATNIQQAVGAAAASDEVVVTNGVYAGGLRVNKPLTLRSVNGPYSTLINGGRTNRCVNLTNGASLSGFTLTNGHAFPGGGVSCASTNAFLSNCVIAGNLAITIPSQPGGGGGAYGGTLYNCTLTGNSSLIDPGFSGGPVYSLYGGNGGGAYGSRLFNCTLAGNSVLGEMLTWDGFFREFYGVFDGRGGGAYDCILYNCTLTGNSAGSGGGAYDGMLSNCTLSGNSAHTGGGAHGGTLNNCIVYFNTAVQGTNCDSSSALNYCCTTPLPTNGVGNIVLDPQMASASHLSASSPCRGAGSAAYATGSDIDGEPWGSPPSIGCDEYHQGAVTGPLTVSLLATYTNVTPDYAVAFTAMVEGRTTASVWEFGDGDVAINQPYISHRWAEAGDYLVSLWAFNESHLGGVSASVTIHVVAQPVYYVAATSSNPQPPYAGWATAATNIQDAVDAAPPGTSLMVLVTNGVYAYGGREGSRVAVDKPLTLLSVNGPQLTVINGGGTNRCVYLTSGASLSGFTLTNGDAYYGGGVGASTNAFLTNCVITGNSAGEYDGGGGGGAYGGWLYNCTLTDNWGGTGGGALYSKLYNCTLTGNLSFWPGGGASASTLNNCIVYYNNSEYITGTNNCDACTLNYCCTTPLPPGPGNLAVPPAFGNTNLWSDLRLQPSSPCINAGNNAYAPIATDLDGNPRIVGGTVDIGAYEFQGTGSVISYAWLQHYGLPTDGSADFTDADLDGMNNWQEWICGTNPTNSLSALRLLSATPQGTNATVSWQSVAGVNYFLERSANLASSLTPLATNIIGQADTTSYADTNATSSGPFFYRVGVQRP